ncbi:phosphoesterase [Methanosarcinales archaeon]|nr:MAG: phosphoesterase [Methanosarcinales archaeon]
MAPLQRELERAAEVIKKHDYARVVSHYDADGITAAGIICNALIRRGIQFHATIISKLDRYSVQEMNEELIIIADMGTAQMNLILKFLKEKDVVILDHHTHAASSLKSSSSTILINPNRLSSKSEERLGGELCAAGLSYLVARLLGSDDERGNVDLAGLAIAGTLGDKLPLDRGINRLILDEAIKEGVVTPRKGLKLGDGKVRDLILLSTDPYIPLAGKTEQVDRFLNKVGIEGEKRLEELGEEDVKRLSSALLSIARESNTELREEALIGTSYLLNLEVEKNVLDFMRMVDACGRFGKAGMGIGLCLREEKLVEEAKSLYMMFQNKLVSELNRIEVAKEGGMKELPNVYYLYVQEKGITGVLAGIIAEYINTSKPVIVLNRKNGANEHGDTKISARCSKKLLREKGIDLSKALEQAASEVGGYGGGHPVASGASIPEGMEERFIAAVDRIIGEQIRTS